MLDAYVQSAAAQADGAKAQLAKLRHDHTTTVAGIVRLLELVEKGLMEAEDPAMRERLVTLKLQRDRIVKEIGELQNRMASFAPTITREKVSRVGGLYGTTLRRPSGVSTSVRPAADGRSLGHRRGDTH
jgi:site-specific DNA recombinase